MRDTLLTNFLALLNFSIFGLGVWGCRILILCSFFPITLYLRSRSRMDNVAWELASLDEDMRIVVLQCHTYTALGLILVYSTLFGLTQSEPQLHFVLLCKIVGLKTFNLNLCSPFMDTTNFQKSVKISTIKFNSLFPHFR